MRDLQADLEICNKATKGPWVFDEYGVDIWSQPDPWRVANVGLYADMQFIAAAREGWPHAIERAIKAEAEVEQLKAELKKVEFWQKHYEEVTKLCKVVDAAREFISSTGCDSKECKKCDPKYIGFCMWSGIGRALAELDKEGERWAD